MCPAYSHEGNGGIRIKTEVVSDVELEEDPVIVSFQGIKLEEDPVPVSFQGIKLEEDPVPVSFQGIKLEENPVPVSFQEIKLEEDPVPVSFQEIKLEEDPVPVSFQGIKSEREVSFMSVCPLLSTFPTCPQVPVDPISICLPIQNNSTLRMDFER
jgi:hypothetical protein